MYKRWNLAEISRMFQIFDKIWNILEFIPQGSRMCEILLECSKRFDKVHERSKNY